MNKPISRAPRNPTGGKRGGGATKQGMRNATASKSSKANQAAARGDFAAQQAAMEATEPE